MFKPEELPCLECMERDRCRDGLKCLSRWKYEKDSGYDAMAKRVRDRIKEQSRKLKERGR